MTIGVSREEFYHSTLVELRDYDEIFHQRRLLEDERDYMCGIYTFQAVQTALANAFRGKGTKPIEYRNKSIMAEIEEQRRIMNPTEEEKKKQLDQLREMLFGMQKRFEESKKAAVE
jgi:flagellar motility protein MotE (MotC chaperone)